MGSLRYALYSRLEEWGETIFILALSRDAIFMRFECTHIQRKILLPFIASVAIFFFNVWRLWMNLRKSNLGKSFSYLFERIGDVLLLH